MNTFHFLEYLERPRKSGQGWMAKCPSHADRTPSLSISEGDDGRTLLHCFSGCTVNEIVNSMELQLSDLFEGTQKRQPQRFYHSIRTKEEAIDRAEMARAGVFQKAESIIKTAKGIDITQWSEKELDRVMDIICIAYSILNEEKGNGQ